MPADADDSPCSISESQGSLDEFSLIKRFFVRPGISAGAWPSSSIGDDCAILTIGAMKIAVTADMMALGTHFLDDADPYTIGRKALAVNLSDLAAAGASPKAFFLSIALPEADPVWLKGFSKGLFEEAERFHCPLRGGDTTKAASVNGMPGKTCISICAMGEVEGDSYMTRGGAKPGDDIWVSGTPGDAYAALGSIWGQFEVPVNDFSYFKARMDTPTPRVELGQKLKSVATACCDISDGLVGDLGHILERSKVSAILYWKDFPRSEQMKRLPEKVQRRCVLSGGDDYELLFTAPKNKRAQIENLNEGEAVKVTRIGEIAPAAEPLKVLDQDGKSIELSKSFNHFA